MLKIEKGVPIPPATRGGALAYPWPSMEDGDSIVVPEQRASSARTSARNWVKRHRPGWASTARTLDDGSVRVWLFVASENGKE